MSIQVLTQMVGQPNNIKLLVVVGKLQKILKKFQ